MPSRLPLLFFLILPGSLLAQDKKKEPPKEPPKLLYANPLGVTLGATTKVTLRGLKLDEATDVRVLEPDLGVKITGKGKVQVPNQQEGSVVGDSQVTFELTVPTELADGVITVVAMSAAGDSQPLRLLVDGTTPLETEKEPNAGFKQATPVTVGSVLSAEISQNQDVDVYRYAGQAGERMVFEVLAARLGAATDAMLVLYDAQGRILATADDRPAAGNARDLRDPLLRFTLPSAGDYFVSVTDANDQGGPSHPYRFLVRKE